MREKPTAAINALIASETLRDHGMDRVAFRHDVLRQWALGNLIADDRSALTKLPLDRPDPPWLRGYRACGAVVAATCARRQ